MGELHARDLWTLVRASVEVTPSALQDLARVDAVIAARRTRSEQFFADAAGEWDATRSALFGARSDLAAWPRVVELLRAGEPLIEIGRRVVT